ncbi:MAG TPA: YbfB/YjiJ family MFS transporter [Burkholderiales bacterium]|nr:YbfB/YjiJ family MFS transporter [Burkholderiales bacterium]
MPIVALAGLAALAVAMGIGRFAFTPLLPMMQADAGLSLAQGGYLASANYVGYLVGALWAARPARAHVAIPAALLAIGAATLAMGFVQGMGGWALLRFIAGVASAWALVNVSSWALAVLGRPVLAGVVFSGVGWGVALAGALCLAMMTHGASASTTWLVLGLVSFGVLAAVWPVLLAHRSAPRASGATARFAWTPDAWRLVACYGAYGFGYIIPATFVPVMARDVIADPAVFGWAWPAFGVTAAVATIWVTRWLPSLGNRRVWMLSALAMAIGVAAPILLAGLAGIALCAVLVGGTFVVITLVGMQEARLVALEHGPTLMAAMTAAFAAGQIAGPLVVSAFIHMHGGFSAALALASTVLVASAFALRAKERPCPT